MTSNIYSESGRINFPYIQILDRAMTELNAESIEQ